MGGIVDNHIIYIYIYLYTGIFIKFQASDVSSQFGDAPVLCQETK